MPQLEIRELTSGYGDVPILHGISLAIEEKQIVAVVGSNGAGKSTLLRTISGLLEPMAGEILFEGNPIGKHPPHDVVARGIVQVPEGRQLFNFMSVMENLRVGSTAKEARTRREETLQTVFSLFPVLAERRNQQAGTLSGGEQQMLAIARGLMARPRVLMMDEPSWGLAPILTKQLFDAVRRINEAGTTILLVEQNVYQSLSLAHRAYVLERGTVVMEGTGKQLLAREDLKTAYLGL